MTTWKVKLKESTDLTHELLQQIESKISELEISKDLIKKALHRYVSDLNVSKVISEFDKNPNFVKTKIEYTIKCYIKSLLEKKRQEILTRFSKEPFDYYAKIIAFAVLSDILKELGFNNPFEMEEIPCVINFTNEEIDVIIYH